MKDTLTKQDHYYERVSEGDLLLRELRHRCSNDLQMVVGLLSLQSRRAKCDHAREALADAMQRVTVLANSRAALQRDDKPTLETALGQVCQALQAHAEPRGILISLMVTDACGGLSQKQVTTIGLIVNELINNAIKHAFPQGTEGKIRVSCHDHESGALTITVEDDGAPFQKASSKKTSGLGLDLAMRLTASIGGLLISPTDGSKLFELRIPRMSDAKHLGA